MQHNCESELDEGVLDKITKGGYHQSSCDQGYSRIEYRMEGPYAYLATSSTSCILALVYYIMEEDCAKQEDEFRE
jgi:hypothetical protein